jgi:hypothetical protein
MCILSHHPKGRLEVVMNLVHVFIETSVMQQLVHKVVPSILNYQAAKQLGQHNVPMNKQNK